MPLTRRRVGALGLAGLTGLAGCSALGGGPITFAAEPATIPRSVQEETGYRRTDQRDTTISRSYAGQDVEVTNWITEFQKELTLPGGNEMKLGVFVAFTTPAVKVAGQGPFNPVSNLSTTQLVQRIQGRFSQLNDVKKVGSTQLSVLGTETAVDQFTGTTTVQGVEVELTIHVAKVQHEDDFVIPVGIYPTQLTAERDNVVTLLGSLRHPA